MRTHLVLRAFTVSGGALAIVALLVLATTGGTARPQVGPVSAARAVANLHAPVLPAPPTVVLAKPHDSEQLMQGESRTTLQGDDINDAIATYGIDDGGNLYEVHSPQTEVPTLGNPST